MTGWTRTLNEQAALRATRRLLSLRNGGVEIVPRLTSNAVHVARHPYRLLWVVFGVEGENPGRPHHDVVDVAPSPRDDNAVNHVPPRIFGEARIQHATHDLFAVGADIPRLGFFPETSSSSSSRSASAFSLAASISRSIPSATPLGNHGAPHSSVVTAPHTGC